MSKLLSALLAGATALALSGAVVAADEQSRDNQTQAQPNATVGKPGQTDASRAQKPGAATTNANATEGKPGQTEATRAQSAGGATTTEQSKNEGGGDLSSKEKEYSADLKKCDSLKGEKKRACVDLAKKKHSQM